MDENYDAFDDYVMTFNLDEHMIAYKYMHSYRVVHQAEEICRSINLDTEERDLASLIALLHDIARFKQWTEYQTYKDALSFDHGDMGAKILFEDGLIKKFNAKEEDYDLIKKAIINHNKFEINKEFNDREKLHCKIIRDADKIDIIYAFSTWKLLRAEEDDENITEEVKDDFFRHESVLKAHVKNKNDVIALMFSMVFDLNYEYSENRILEEKYLEKFYEGLKHKEIFKPYLDEAIKYLKGKKKNVRK